MCVCVCVLCPSDGTLNGALCKDNNPLGTQEDFDEE